MSDLTSQDPLMDWDDPLFDEAEVFFYFIDDLECDEEEASAELVEPIGPEPIEAQDRTGPQRLLGSLLERLGFRR